jgi:hypothetical protein
MEVSQGVAAGREVDWKTAELALHCVRWAFWQCNDCYNGA